MCGVRRIDDVHCRDTTRRFLDAILDAPPTSGRPAGSGSSKRLPDAPTRATSIHLLADARVPGGISRITAISRIMRRNLAHGSFRSEAFDEHDRCGGTRGSGTTPPQG
jgi:hypothetical protein